MTTTNTTVRTTNTNTTTSNMGAGCGWATSSCTGKATTNTVDTRATTTKRVVNVVVVGDTP